METAKDWAQIVSWIVASLGGVFAAFYAIYQMQQNREQRKDELRFKKLQESKELLDQLFDDERSNNFMRMLDWSGRKYEIEKDRRETITQDELYVALRIADLSFDAKQAYIRDCADSFFGTADMIGHYVRMQLVLEEVVSQPLLYYVQEMNRKSAVFVNFMEAYGYDRALGLFDKILPNWRS